MRKAVLFGASGFIGSYLLDLLLKNPAYEQVTVVVRKPLSISHPKLKQLEADHARLASVASELTGDDLFIALGTTKQQTPDKDEYYRIDHDYPLLAATYAKAQGMRSLALVSSVGASAESSTFYLRLKGELERDISALNFPHTHIFRPSMLLGPRQAKRPLEKLFQSTWKLIDPLIPARFSRYRGIEGEAVAKAMVRACEAGGGKVRVYHWDDMQA